MIDELHDVWELETQDEQRAVTDLLGIVDCAFVGHRWAIAYLEELWDEENWGDIKERLDTEGSTWCVWWMDGVRKHLAQSRKRVGELTSRLT